ncbi:MAG: hypothetical protein QOD29_4508, partial [Alphaproteobacteria bacterium]|nr:hypothetical protein [Alphaproteobacteria bacterium]
MGTRVALSRMDSVVQQAAQYLPLVGGGMEPVKMRSRSETEVARVLRKLASERILVLDGAMGTMIQAL